MAFTKLYAGNGRSKGYYTATTVSGATESEAADLGGFCNCGLMVPAVTSGTYTFEVSNLSNGSYYGVYDTDGSTALSFTTVSGSIALESNDLKALAGYEYVKIVGPAQTADVDFIWTLKA